MSGFDHLLAQLRAAGEATRLRTLCLLREGELTVTELTEILGQSQPRVSRHLKVLADAGLVERFQEGAWVFYRLSAEATGGALSDLLTAKGVEAPAEDLAELEHIRERRAEAAAAYFAAHAEEWEALRSLHIADEDIERALLEFVDEPIDTFIDLGTGTGRMLMLFADKYQQGLGFDTSPEMLSVARAQLVHASLTHAQVRRGDFLSDELPGDADVVCLHHVLHYLSAPERAIAVAARSLRPGGKILVADFAPHDHEDLRETNAHRRLGFSDEEIAAWAKRSGLMVTGDRRFDPPLPGGLVSRVWCLSSRTDGSSRRDAHSDLRESHVQN